MRLYFNGIFIISYIILALTIMDFGTSLLSEPNTLYVILGGIIDFTVVFVTIYLVIRWWKSNFIIKNLSIEDILKRKGFIK